MRIGTSDILLHQMGMLSREFNTGRRDVENVLSILTTIQGHLQGIGPDQPLPPQLQSIPTLLADDMVACMNGEAQKKHTLRLTRDYVQRLLEGHGQADRAPATEKAFIPSGHC